MREAHLDKLKPGDVLIPDSGFDCMDEGKPVLVHTTATGELWVPCSSGKHKLEGQLPFYDDSDILVGMRLL